MRKPVHKRKGYDEGGVVRRPLGDPDPPETIDVDKAADEYRRTSPKWNQRLDRRIKDNPNDPMIVSGTAGTTRDAPEFRAQQWAVPRLEQGMARGGKVKKVMPVKRKRR
jgi:hypothetical protein